MEDINNAVPTLAHPEFPEVLAACPPGTNPAPAPVTAPAKAKRAKAVAKLHYVTHGVNLERDCRPYPHFEIIRGSEDGFRTKEEMAKFIRTLPPGKYTPISVPSKTVTIALATKVSIKGI
jgi:hypothetical protein